MSVALTENCSLVALQDVSALLQGERGVGGSRVTSANSPSPSLCFCIWEMDLGIS